MSNNPFDILGPLPHGTTLLEASAGTGKTYTIAMLATRYIAEGATTIDRMLLITFGRSATRELRERVRETLARAREALRSGTAEEDALTAYLGTLTGTQRQLAGDRVAKALADFDAGTIVTTHSFCHDALKALGLHADTDPGEQFVENITDIIDEVVDDFYVRKYAGQPTDQRMTVKEAKELARRAVGDPQADLDAGPAEPGSIEHTRVAFAKAVREEVVARRRARRLLTFDDLVLRLRDALTDPVSGEAACQRLRDLYHLVLVDEFQDTDPAQWTILQRAFHGHRPLVLIGDPKQAIYAFRGADVFSYLAASEQADNHATLPTNWRSDAAVVDGIQALVGGLELGDPRIVVKPVSAAHERSRLLGLPSDQRVILRTVDADEPPRVGVARKAVVADVVAEISDLLEGPARLLTGGHPRPVAPRDIAVLVATNEQGDLVRTGLAAAGIPAVTSSTSSVFATAAAKDWATMLAAIQQPRGSLLRDAALTDFFGYAPVDLATDGDQVDTEVSLTLRAWGQILQTQSFAQMVAVIERDSDLGRRVLSRPDGERHLTDLRHVAHAVHAHQRTTRSGVVALHDWLTDQIRRANAGTNEPTRELTRRLDTDAQAVQVLTIHTSKGLEFPIAFVPFGWDQYEPKKEGPITCHDGGRRVLDLRGDSAQGRKALVAARDREDAGERLRLLYVALTRASSLLIVHWAASMKNTSHGPLHRALCAKAAGTLTPAASYPVGAAPTVESEWVAVRPVAPRPARRWTPETEQIVDLSVAAFTRTIDAQWRRTSYSGLTRTVHESERSPGGFRDDEPEEVDSLDGAPDPVIGELAGLRSPFADLPAGAAFGTLVHAVLEVTDTAATNLDSEVTQRCREQLLWNPVPQVTPEDLAHAILPALRTPLGSLAEGLPLAQIPPRDRLAELDFELPMGGHGVNTVADIAALLRDHLPAGDPLAGYPDRLESAGLTTATLVGFLAGSIDGVLRVPGGRYVVVDYKTNLLREPSEPGVETLVRGYGPLRLAEAMMEAHYPLQALLYGAALHRYLRWRLPGYDASRHLGGVLYLFVRGMAGASTPPGYGVFSWQPPPALIRALSDLLDGRRP